eukprot:CAMPEP_0184644264 /NCGR_PEP_ID=MMETSP0308-20130426/1017_1 /TAXON_ID=38269 /ORGANISM="Gloeochaete witrockiana, Strain SAG 46.84" /LENGTH=351 /DNA_ID=CAMNT_0027072701 /DNA_START=444 /DNA_END=1499 /DNA_ORIENTATION=+
MTKATCLEGPLGEALAADGKDRSEFVVLALQLLYERSLGDRSFWAPYINILPDSVDLTIFWPEDVVIKLLQGSPALTATRRLRAQVDAAWNDIRTVLLPQFPKLFPSAVFHQTSFEWAFSMVVSRAVFLQSRNCIAMVPFADMLNHSDASNKFLYFDPRAKSVRLRANRDYEPGEQVFVSYGQKSNAELLVGYGFAIRDNLYDSVELELGLDDTDAALASKEALLARYNLKPLQKFPVMTEKFTAEMMAWMRVSQLNNEAEVRAYGQKIFEAMDKDKRVNVLNERAVVQQLVSVFEELLALYPSPLQETALMWQFRNSDRGRYAEMTRTGEKRILNACREEALDRLRDLPR